MIVGSLLLIVVAVGLLALGLVRGSNPYLVGSIAASLLAAIALIAGSRQTGRVRLADADEDSNDEVAGDEFAAERVGGARSFRRRARREPGTRATSTVREAPADEELASTAVMAERRVQTAEPAIPVQSAAADDEDPADEPVAQQVTAAEAARVARMTTDVLVIDGRPRYHLAGCVHLLDRESEPLPVGEAVELGFTPCGLCEPDTALLAEARRV